jgi:probable rRNA maturation factor|tara:strand:+ start:254 stop:712 length:459 start_codon:yes stop_codon:yes gene_type:complete
MIDAEVLIESNNWKKIIQNPKRLILNILKKFPKRYKFVNKKVYISILLTSNNKIKLLNKKFRKKNKPTDILSFPFFDKKSLRKNLKSKKFYLGDIVISYEEFSKQNKNDYKDGFIKIFIHGFLHLLSFDHKLDKDYKIMNSIENNIFQKVKG